MHRLVLIFALIAAALPAWALSVPFHFDPGARVEAPDPGVVPAIRFLTTTDYPPFNFRASDGELIGFNVDLARAICNVLEVGCTIQAWPWDQAADALADNQGDALIAGLAITPQTAERFDFSHTYMMLPGRFVTARTEAPRFDARALDDAKVAVRQGSDHAAFMLSYLPKADTAEFETESAALEALAAGEADAYFGDALRASFWLNRNPACCAFAGEAYFRTDLFGRGLAVAFPAGHNAVRGAVDWALVRLKQDGTLDQLYLRWFPVSFY